MASDQPIRVDKGDPIKMDSEESPHGGSSADEESGELGEGEGEGGMANPTPEQAPKRKGGRKPIYATTEERKQRNRQAQAAFRERRTEYIKQLENTINMQEATLNNLNAAHRQTTDECLMLRYKNSLLERVLLEKGIDVQAELQAKHGSSNFGPTHPIPQMPVAPQMSRTLLNKHNSRRSTSTIAPKIETGYPLPPPVQGGHLPAASPKSRGTAASPTAVEGFGHSPASDHAPSIMRPMKQPGHAAMGGHMGNPARMMPPLPQQQMGHPQAPVRMGSGGHPGAFYETPQYQQHIDQLEREYDAAADMMDEQQQQQGQSEAEPGGLGPYPGSVYASHAAQQQQQQQMSPPATTAAEATGHPQHRQQQPSQQHGLPMGGMVDPMGDPGLDWGDPFGLSASMAFPTSFSFDTSNMR